MKNALTISFIAVAVMLSLSSGAVAEQPPEMIAEKMAVKFTRGVVNTVTSVVEIPKQTVLTIRDMGGVGVIVGPLKGIGMTFYRGIIGLTETVFFAVPQPGYYDPLMDPPYVWEGWEPKHDTSKTPVNDAK